MARVVIAALLFVACSWTPASATGVEPGGSATARSPEPGPEPDLCTLVRPFAPELADVDEERRELRALLELRGWSRPCKDDPPPELTAEVSEPEYCRLILRAGICRDDEALRLVVERFPDRPGTWLWLASAHAELLRPDAESGLPYNADIPSVERLRIADELLEAVARAEAIEPDDRTLHRLREWAYTQRMYARLVVAHPETPEELLEGIEARQDAMDAWRARRRICELDALPECPAASAGACCPPPPMTAEEIAADRRRKAELEARRSPSAAGSR